VHLPPILPTASGLRKNGIRRAITNKILGGDMIDEIALAIEMGADAVDIGKTIHRIPRWARASAWLRRLRMAVVRMCRLRGSNLLASDCY
jgi:hypothetical protein